MITVENYKSIATQSDYHKSFDSKTDLIFLVRKYLRNNDGNIPNSTVLRKLKKSQLKVIWMKYRPKDIWNQFYFL